MTPMFLRNLHGVPARVTARVTLSRPRSMTSPAEQLAGTAPVCRCYVHAPRRVPRQVHYPRTAQAPPCYLVLGCRQLCLVPVAARALPPTGRRAPRCVPFSSTRGKLVKAVSLANVEDVGEALGEHVEPRGTAGASSMLPQFNDIHLYVCVELSMR